MIVEPGRPEGPLIVSDIQAQSVHLSWKPPQDDGGGEIEGYLIEAKDVLHLDIHKKYIWVEGQETECLVDDLVTSHIYQFRVCAQNEAGRGDALLHKTPVRVKAPNKRPVAPSKPVAKIEEDNAVFLQWSVLTDSEDLSFLVERRDVNSDLWMQCNHEVVKKREFLIVGLRENTEYRFRVSSENAHGLSLPSEESDTILISKQIVAPPKILVPLKNCFVKLNEDAHFFCEYTGTPPIQAYWTKDGIRICEGFRAIIRTEENRKSSLTLEEVDSEDDNSIVQCDLRNVEGKTFTEAEIKLLSPPKITAPASYKSGLSFDCGESLRIKFQLSGKPTPTVKWYFNENEGVHGSERTTISLTPDAVELRVCELTAKDTGHYKFVASNDIGTDEIDVLVTVNGPPDPPSVEKLSTANADGDLKLEWEAPEYDGGSSVFNYIIEKCSSDKQNWLRLGTTFDTSFVFKPEDEIDESLFRIKSVNVYGTSEPSKEFHWHRPIDENVTIVPPLHSICDEEFCSKPVEDHENLSVFKDQSCVVTDNALESHESDKADRGHLQKFTDSQDIPLNVLFVATQASLPTAFLNYASIGSVDFYETALFAVEVPVLYKVTEKDIQRNNCYLICEEITKIDQFTDFRMKPLFPHCIQPSMVKKMCLEIFEPFSEIAHYIDKENELWYLEVLLCGIYSEDPCRMRGLSSVKYLTCVTSTVQYERCIHTSFSACVFEGLQSLESSDYLPQYALIILDYCEAVTFHETWHLDQVVNTESFTTISERESESFTEEIIENNIDQRCYQFTTCKPAMSVLPVRKSTRLELDSMHITHEETENRFDDSYSRALCRQLSEIEKSIIEGTWDDFEQSDTNARSIPPESSERYTYLPTDSKGTLDKDHSSREISHCNSSEKYNRTQEVQNISSEEFDSTRWRKHSDPNNKTELTVKVPPWLRNVTPHFTTPDSVLNENTSGSENEIAIEEKKDIQGDVCKYEVREKSVRELLNLAEEVERRFTEKTEQIESLENLLQSELTSLESDLAVVSEIHRNLGNESDILLPVDLFSDKFPSMTVESEKHEGNLIDFDKAVECTEPQKSNQEEYAPEIITHLQNRVVQSGNRTRLYCSISGKPDPQVVWLKNGKILPKSTRHIFNNLMEFGFYIDIYNAMSSDSGMYTCIATNCHGVAQTQAYLRVMGRRAFSPEEPKFLKSPGDIKVNIGDTVTLEWKISGTPVPNVIWFKNAEKIETSLKLDAFSNHRGCCRLVLHDVTADDCAIYSCYLENEAGSSVSTVLVSVTDGTNESAILPDNSDVVLNVKEKCYILDDLDLSLLDLEERLRKEALLFESMPFKRTMNEEHKGAPLIPGRPFAPTTVSVGCTWAILSWTVPLDYRERDSTLVYRIEKRRLTSNRWKEVGRTKNTVFTAHGLKSGKSYAFRISAGNREGWGPAATLPHPVNCSS